LQSARAIYAGHEYFFSTYGPNDRISRRLIEGKFHEYRTLTAIRKLGARGVYIDVGAHIGNHAVFFGCECPSTEVIAIEATPESRVLLEQNLAANLKKPFRVLPDVIGREGEGHDPVIVDEGNTGAMQFIPGSAVRSRSLDNLFPDLVDVALIKLDIEGGEPAALEGGIQLIRRNLPVLIIESGREETEAACNRLLVPLGYRRTRELNHPPNVFWRARKGLLGWHH